MNQQPIVEKAESSFRGMIRWATALVVTIVVCPAPLAFAQDEQRPKVTAAVVIAGPMDTRPSVLVPLYVWLAGLQAYDG